MTKFLVLVAAATLMLGGSASAQDKAPASELKPMLNCHPPSNGAAAWNFSPFRKQRHSAVCRWEHNDRRGVHSATSWSVRRGAQRLSAGNQRAQRLITRNKDL